MTAFKRGWIVLICISFLLSCAIGLFCFGEHPTVLSVVYDGSYLQKRMAYVWTDMLIESVDCIEDLYDINLTESAPRNGNAYCIELVVSDTMEAGKWRMESVDGKRLIVQAADYNGFVGASRYFAKVWQKNGTYPLAGEEIREDSYVWQLQSIERSTAYAYDRRGEYRVMFYNVLFYEPLPTERNLLQAEMFRQYLPDVIGLQEFNDTKRHLAGENDLSLLLSELGYREAVDPIVDNASCEAYKLSTVYDETGKRIGYKPNPNATLGTTISSFAGAGDRDYDFERTYFNHTPLFYNLQTTKLIDAGYYWYENQWDLGEMTEGTYYVKKGGALVAETGSYHPSVHENGASDCASKSATWGVFESIETGERYIAISTHMCTRSEAIRALQGQEMVELIARLVEQYDCPVILGGDYNGNYGASNYRIFEESGLVDVEKDNLPTVYNSKTRTSHAYPAYNEEKGIVDVAPKDNTGSASSAHSVDHIMIGNVDEGSFEVAVFGVIIDEMTLSGSDHFPMMMDFSIGSADTD